MRPIVIGLPPDEYARLAERASANDRDIHQEARHVVRTALGSATFSNTPAGPGAGFPSPFPAPAAGPAKNGDAR